MDRVLFVLTNHSELGSTGKKTGAHLAEITHPYEVLRTAGLEIDFVSPQGGPVPLEHVDMDDSINEKWMGNEVFAQKLKHTLHPDQLISQQYGAIFYPSGHGVMFDVPGSERIAQCAAEIYEAGGVVAAVCHGTAGLVSIKVDGEPLVKGKDVAAFTNEEEVTVGLVDQVPFLLEDRLIEEGAEVRKELPFQKNVVVSGRLITGQNPASSRSVAEEMRKMISPSTTAFLDRGDMLLSP